MASVLKRPQAELDLLEIWSYISQDNFEAADRFLDWINSRLELLATQPLMGRAWDELMPCLRSFPVGNFVIFYTPLMESWWSVSCGAPWMRVRFLADLLAKPWSPPDIVQSALAKG